MPAMSCVGEFSRGRTLLILSIVVGCLVVLWPKIFYPMLTASLNLGGDADMDCCDVISEKDGNAHELMNAICASIVRQEAAKPLEIPDPVEETGNQNLPKWKKYVKPEPIRLPTAVLCRNEILRTCRVDVILLLKETPTLTKEYKESLRQLRSFNTSQCLRDHYGVHLEAIGLPRRIKNPEIAPSHMRPERQMYSRADELIHPALRERGSAIPHPKLPHPNIPPRRTIDMEMRPGPKPGIRPPLGSPAHNIVPHHNKGGGTMGIVMPLYTIGIIVFFLYTIMKIMSRKPEEPEFKRSYLSAEQSSSDYRHQVLSEDYLRNGTHHCVNKEPEHPRRDSRESSAKTANLGSRRRSSVGIAPIPLIPVVQDISVHSQRAPVALSTPVNDVSETKLFPTPKAQSDASPPRELESRIEINLAAQGVVGEVIEAALTKLAAAVAPENDNVKVVTAVKGIIAELDNPNHVSCHPPAQTHCFHESSSQSLQEKNETEEEKVASPLPPILKRDSLPQSKKGVTIALPQPDEDEENSDDDEEEISSVKNCSVKEEAALNKAQQELSRQIIKKSEPSAALVRFTQELSALVLKQSLETAAVAVAFEKNNKEASPKISSPTPAKVEKVSVVGMEETAGLENGQKWKDRSPTPTFQRQSPLPPIIPAEVPNIYLEGKIPATASQVMVSDSHCEIEDAEIEDGEEEQSDDEDFDSDNEKPVVLSGKVTLSVLSDRITTDDITEATSISLDDYAKADPQLTGRKDFTQALASAIDENAGAHGSAKPKSETSKENKESSGDNNDTPMDANFVATDRNSDMDADATHYTTADQVDMDGIQTTAEETAADISALDEDGKQGDDLSEEEIEDECDEEDECGEEEECDEEGEGDEEDECDEEDEVDPPKPPSATQGQGKGSLNSTPSPISPSPNGTYFWEP